MTNKLIENNEKFDNYYKSLLLESKYKKKIYKNILIAFTNLSYNDVDENMIRIWNSNVNYDNNIINMKMEYKDYCLDLKFNKEKKDTENNYYMIVVSRKEKNKCKNITLDLACFMYNLCNVTKRMEQTDFCKFRLYCHDNNISYPETLYIYYVNINNCYNSFLDCNKNKKFITLLGALFRCKKHSEVRKVIDYSTLTNINQKYELMDAFRNHIFKSFGYNKKDKSFKNK